MPHSNRETSINEVNWAGSQKTQKFRITDTSQHKNEAISFWNDAPLFHSSANQQYTKEPQNKFTIEKIELDSQGRKILYGPSQIAIVSGIFAESKFQIGQKVTVAPCLCCTGAEENAESFSCDDFILDSSDQIDGNFTLDKTVFYVNSTRNTILIEDDLLTVTSLCAALKCINIPLLQTLVSDLSFEFAHPSLVLGILIHKLIQMALIEKKATLTFLVSTAKSIIMDNLILLYSCNISDKEALNEILKNIKNIIRFLDRNFQVEKVEHKVFSTVYGLKGSIDCLDSNFVIEIKTGKFLSLEHRSQAILYSLLMMETDMKNRRSAHDHQNSMSDAKLRTNTYTPLLYYVKSGDFVDIDLQHEEIVHLLKLRNDIATNKCLSNCDCPETYPCAILNKIKLLPSSHFLRKQLEAIELEACREKSFFKANKTSQNQERLCLKVSERLLLNEFVYLYTVNHNFITLGLVEAYENDHIVIILRENINLEKNMLVCLDDDTNFLTFMRWSLVQIAFPKFLRKDCKGQGIDSFLLPGQEHGLEVKCEMSIKSHADSCSIDSDAMATSSDNVELTSLDLESDFSSTNCCEYNTKKPHVSIKSLDQPTQTIKESIVSTCTVHQKRCSQSISNSLKTKFLEDVFSSEIENIRQDSDLYNEFVFKTPYNNQSIEHGIDINADDNVLENAPSVPNAKRNKEARDSSKDDGVYKNDSCSNLISSEVKASQSTSSSLHEKPKVLFNETSPPFDCSQYFNTQNQGRFSKSSQYPIPEGFKDEFLKLNDEQRQALFLSLNCENYKIIHGMPGTGKSTVISLLIRILISYGKKVLLVCYTHLAIHNILKKVGKVKCYRAKKEDLKFKSYAELAQHFKDIDLVAGTCYSFGDPVYLNRKFDYCVIDEGSQMHLLLSLIPISIADRFCIVGDHLQLKPLCKKSRDLNLSLFEFLIDHCSTLTRQYRMGDLIMKLSNTLFYDNRLIGFGGLSTVVFLDSDRVDVLKTVKEVKNCAILCYFNSKVREISNINKDVIVTTIDRFQGSESDEIIVIFDPVEKCEIIESRERLNVALTRARTKLTLVGSKRDMLEIPLFRQLIDMVV
ncbi:uncharacterized protein VICG_01016 [Vittaforma corneae ATCC 50505]|uniref:Helicase ATP-binding domain-containing protein n=1 Tax=Vittaforma corneae (strain ATCC 50505) TaxID=993615 RepID=L2GMZ7_VITCO|nr:uncharacterized protein VICG_01016 [Vittaforma corneae ATCC 50505]ELA41999.1 hypothetical protein VICG_01016 [Vittaforma corneae ATCC 50505]